LESSVPVPAHELSFMPKIKLPPPKGILDHLVKRYLEKRISEVDFLELKHWLESDPDVPDGKWYKRFKTGTLAGNGDRVSTFLAPGMAIEGDEVQ
jgi:hypothetical protein